MSDKPYDEEAIFKVACQIMSPDARAVYLNQVCGDAPAVFERMTALLRVHDEESRFLELSPPGLANILTIDQPPLERPGTQIGPYKLLQQIGEGGFGVVFMAEQTEPVRRKVALKLIKPGMDTRQVIARFEAERQALAVMDHPNIAKVLDAGTVGEGIRDQESRVRKQGSGVRGQDTWDKIQEAVYRTPDSRLLAPGSGRPYFVMELVRGIPITQYCDENNLPIRERLELFATVCQAIQHAHTKGIIHRDIKPTNVLVTRQDGQPVVKVIDFGIAKAMGQQLTDKTLFTDFAQMIGTPLYMSPEQAELSSVDIDTRSDIYSLGVLLYELLTGSTPVSKEQLRQAAFDEIRRIIREDEPPKPSTRISTAEAAPSIAAQRHTEPAKLARLVRGELDWIVMKALEKDRSRRYESASGFARDVQRYLADEAVLACPPSAAYRLRKYVKRNKTRLLIAAGALVLLLVIGVGIPVNAVLRQERDAAVANQVRAERAEAKTRELLDEQQITQKEIKIRLHLSQARADRHSGQIGQRFKCLEELTAAAKLDPGPELRLELRDEAIAAMALPDVRLGPNWHPKFPVHHPCCFDAQYRLCASVNDQGVISVCSISDNREIQNIEGPPIKSGSAWIGRFSPDGQYLATLELGNAPLRVWRVADGKAMLREDLSPTLAWAFSPDSRQLAVGQLGSVIRFDLTTGQELNRWQLPGTASVYSLAFHPDNHRLAVGYHNSLSFVSVYDATNGELVANLPVSAGYEQVVAWHPDGERLAVASSDPSIQIWNVAAQRKVATLEGHAQNVTFLSFHPGGDLLTSTSWDGTVRLWDPSTARKVMQLPMNMTPQFSSDGRWLGIARYGEEAKMLEVSTTREYRTLVSSDGAGQGGYYSGDISPDGRLLTLGMDDGTCLWDLPSGRELARLPDASYAAFFDRLGERWDLLTSTATGLQRWPARIVGSGVQLGPRQQLSPLQYATFARSPEGRTLAAVHQSEDPIQILDLERGVVRQKLGVHPQGEGHALSPDGRWLASRGWHSDRVRLWNAETGQVVQEWVRATYNTAFFTPDSRTLIISQGDEFRFHDVENPLKPFRRIRRDAAQFPGFVAFSPNGELMALEMAPGVIHLKDAASARTVARLEDPSGDRASWMSFTPDGTQLVVAAPYAHAVHVWDLRAIRQRLKGMGLDWDWPEFKPASEFAGPDDAPTIQVIGAESHYKRGVEVASKGLLDEAVAAFRKHIEIDPTDAAAYDDLGGALFDQQKLDAALACYKRAIELDPTRATAHNNLGCVLRMQGKLDEAIACFKQAIELAPKYARAYDNLGAALKAQEKVGEAIASIKKASEIEPNNAERNNHLAWLLATCPQPEFRDATEAVRLAQKAVEMVPNEGNYWCTLGVAHYRADDWRAAITALEKARALRGIAFVSFDAFFLAMSYWRLDNQEEARKWYDQAVAWMEKYQPKNEELLRFRAEADELMKKD